MKVCFTVMMGLALTAFSQTPPDYSNLFSSESLSDDYANKGYQVKLALPDLSGKTRIWLKGSAKFPTAKIQGAKETIVLQPPYYTTTVLKEKGTDPIKINFLANKSSEEVTVYPSWFNADEKYSIMVFSCFQPFDFQVSDMKFHPDGASKFANHKIRKAFNSVALGKPLGRVDVWTAGKATYLRDTQLLNPRLVNTPKLVIGMGDEVYVDAGYESAGKNVLPAWEIKYKPMPKIADQAAYASYLNTLYENFYSFNTMKEVYAKMPSMNIWDDHEIRDGWGSHGDEHQPLLRNAYTTAKHAFVHNMFMHPDLPSNYADSTVDLSQSVETPQADIFIFDLRSTRDVNVPTVISAEQWAKFENWCKGLKDGRTIIIGSSIPLFWKIKHTFSEVFSHLHGGEGVDDLADAWDSGYNQTERNKLIKKIIELKEKKMIKTIVISGDIHLGALSEVWYVREGESRDKRRVLCYEMITSGLSHESVNGKMLDTWLVDHSGGHRVGETLTTINFEGTDYNINNTVKIEGYSHNFGNINFDNGAAELHLFLKEPENNLVEDFVLKCMWNKTNAEEEVNEKWSRLRPNTYEPAPPEFKYDFYVEKIKGE